MQKSPLPQEKEDDQIRQMKIAEVTAVRAVVSTHTSQVDHLIVTKNQVVVQMMILMIIIRAVGIQRKVDTSTKNPDQDPGHGPDQSHHIRRHRRKDVVSLFSIVG